MNPVGFYTDKSHKKRPVHHPHRYLFPTQKNKVIFESNNMSPYHTGKMKHAIDIVVPVGTKVYAAREGVVTDIDTDKDGNKSIELEHSDGAITDYSHLSKFLVKEGQNVKEGETIAQSGSSGDLGGLPPHLHFEVDEPDSESNYYTGYHSVPFEWKRAPQTETRIVELKYNQEFYSRAVKKRHVWNSDTALRDPYSEHETINDG